MTAATLAFGKNAVAKQWFTAISDIGDVIEGATRGDSIEKMLEYVHRRMASLIPGASLSRFVNQAVSDTKSERKVVKDNEDPELRELDRLTGIYKQNLPGWGTLYGKPYPALSHMITGEPIANENTWLGAISPFRVSTNKNDVVLNELAALDGAGLPRELPRVVGGPQPASPFKLPGEEEKAIREGVLLSTEERGRLSVLLTKEIKSEDGETLHEALKTLIESDDYKEQKDGKYGGKATRIALLFNSYLEQAERALFEEYPRLGQIVQRRQLERGLQKLPTGMEDQENDMRGMLQNR